jgi:hypothetical protein
MAAPSADRPTREQLVALLFSDSASEAFEGDALAMLARDIDTRAGRLTQDSVRLNVMMLLDMISAETSGLDLLGEDMREDLKSLACTAKRAAILALHAAFAAEQALAPKPRSAAAPNPQLSLVTDPPAPPRRRSR